MRAPVFGFLFALLIVPTARGATLHVSLTGYDRNAGTDAQPFATMTRARDEVRHRPVERPITVIVHGGITSEVYTKRYPELVGFLNPQPTTPRNSQAHNNVMVRCTEVSNGNWQWDPDMMWSTSDDPGFVDAAHDDFRQRKDAELFRRLPDFRPIPFEQIGPQAQLRQQ